MLYQLQDFGKAWASGLSMAAHMSRIPLTPFASLGPTPWAAADAWLEAVARTTQSYPKRSFDLPIREELVWQRPFGGLLRFAADGSDRPRILLFAPMSGHGATLLRDTVSALLGRYEVFVTDWHDARDVPVGDGAFDFDDYIAYVLDMFGAVAEGGPFHAVAVCQPTVPVLVATAIASEQRSHFLPRSLALLAGPIDPGANETEVTRLAQSRSSDWFERTMIHRVPMRYAGAGRRVYPGCLQLAAFLAMNPDRHLAKQVDLFRLRMLGNHAAADKIASFYDEYLTTLDMTAEFFLSTVERVFRRRELAQGRFEWRGRSVDMAAIETVRLLTVEGAQDDISAPGQTDAAHRLCRNLPESMRARHLQEGAGHYGVFSGSRFRLGVLPAMERHFAAATSEPAKGIRRRRRPGRETKL